MIIPDEKHALHEYRLLGFNGRLVKMRFAAFSECQAKQYFKCYHGIEPDYIVVLSASPICLSKEKWRGAANDE